MISRASKNYSSVFEFIKILEAESKNKYLFASKCYICSNPTNIRYLCL